MANTPVIEKFLQAIETAAIPGCDAWSADATLDATVPGWRLHATGADAIRTEYARWFADPGRFDELRRYTVQDGTAGGGPTEVVEYTLSWTENGVPHAGHHLHLLTDHLETLAGHARALMLATAQLGLELVEL